MDDVVTVSERQGGYRIPKSLLDAVSDIQQYAVLESEGATDLPRDHATLIRNLAYFAIGFHYGIGDGILLFLFAPFLFAAFEGLIPVFGEAADLFDRIYVFILSKYFSIGLFFLMVFVLSKAKGSVSRSLAKTLVSGYVASCAVRAFAFLYLYRFIHMNWGRVLDALAEYYYTFEAGIGDGTWGRLNFFLSSLTAKLYHLAVRVEPVIVKTSNYETLFHLLLILSMGAVWIYYTRVKYYLVKNPFYGRFS